MQTFKLTLERGQALLDGLLKSGIALGHECGGTLACATCCVIVRDGFGALSPMGEDEQDMLERAGASGRNARLACQVISSGGEVVIEVLDSGILRRIEPARNTVAAIDVSERAAKHLAAQLAKHPEAVAVRLSVEPAGCSGLRYRLDHAEAIAADDAVFEIEGVRIAVGQASLSYLQGVTLDVVQAGLGWRLRMHNPNARQTCGCGESFAA